MTKPEPPPTPGQILAEKFLKPLGITTEQLAAELNCPPIRISALVSGRSGLLTDTAARLARYFGTTDRYWMDLQSDYDLYWTRSRLEIDLAAIVPLGAGTGAS